MSLDFDGDGYLVPGEHDVPWPRFLDFFCSGQRRTGGWVAWAKGRAELVLEHLAPLIHEITQHGPAEEFVLHGKFATQLPCPERIDVLLPVQLQTPFCRYLIQNQTGLRSKYRVDLHFGVTNERVTEGSYFQRRAQFQKRESGSQGIVILACN